MHAGNLPSGGTVGPRVVRLDLHLAPEDHVAILVQLVEIPTLQGARPFGKAVGTDESMRVASALAEELGQAATVVDVGGEGFCRHAMPMASQGRAARFDGDAVLPCVRKGGVEKPAPGVGHVERSPHHRAERRATFGTRGTPGGAT